MINQWIARVAATTAAAALALLLAEAGNVWPVARMAAAQTPKQIQQPSPAAKPVPPPASKQVPEPSPALKQPSAPPKPSVEAGPMKIEGLSEAQLSSLAPETLVILSTGRKASIDSLRKEHEARQTRFSGAARLGSQAVAVSPVTSGQSGPPPGTTHVTMPINTQAAGDYQTFCKAAAASGCLYFPQAVFMNLPGRDPNLLFDYDPLMTNADVCVQQGGTPHTGQNPEGCAYGYPATYNASFNPGPPTAQGIGVGVTSTQNCMPPATATVDPKGAIAMKGNVKVTLFFGQGGVSVPGTMSTVTCVVNVFIASTKPSITSINPLGGPAGTKVTINGGNLAAGAVVNVGSAKATGVTAAGPYSITAVMPGGLIGSLFAQDKVDLSVTVAGQTSNVVSFAYCNDAAPYNATLNKCVAPVPTISSIDPPGGPAGTKVTISGTNFSSNPLVNVGTTQSKDVVVAGPGKITAVLPAAVNSGANSETDIGLSVTALGETSKPIVFAYCSAGMEYSSAQKKCLPLPPTCGTNCPSANAAYPPGSYVNGCTDIGYDKASGVLYGHCGNPNYWVALNVPACDPRSDIAAVPAGLQCQARAGTWGAGGAVPKGSYLSTCTYNIVVPFSIAAGPAKGSAPAQVNASGVPMAHALTAQCPTSSGGTVAAVLDLSGCDMNRDIQNSNGILVCNK